MKIFQLWFYAYQTTARNPGNTVVATNTVFDLLMTSDDLNDLQKWKCFNYGFMHIKRKLGIQEYSTARNPVFHLLMTSYDL